MSDLRLHGLHVQVWVEYARWHAADGGGGPQQAASILARARKVNTCSGLHAFDDCHTVMLTGTACLLPAHVLHAPESAVDCLGAYSQSGLAALSSTMNASLSGLLTKLLHAQKFCVSDSIYPS